MNCNSYDAGKTTAKKRAGLDRELVENFYSPHVIDATESRG